MANSRTVHRVTGAIQTTDATQTTIVSYTVPANTVAGFQGSIIAKDASGNLLFTIPIGAASRAGGGTSIVGSIVNLFTPITSVALATASVTADASGNDIRVRVTGVALTTIDWFCELKVWIN